MQSLDTEYLLHQLDKVSSAIRLRRYTKNTVDLDYNESKSTVSMKKDNADGLMKQWGIDVIGILQKQALQSLAKNINDEYASRVMHESLSVCDGLSHAYDIKFDIDGVFNEIALDDVTEIYISTVIKDKMNESSFFNPYCNETGNHLTNIGSYRNIPVYAIDSNERFIIANDKRICIMNYDNNSLSCDINVADTQYEYIMTFKSSISIDNDFYKYCNVIKFKYDNIGHFADKFKRWEF